MYREAIVVGRARAWLIKRRPPPPAAGRLVGFSGLIWFEEDALVPQGESGRARRSEG